MGFEKGASKHTCIIGFISIRSSRLRCRQATPYLYNTQGKVSSITLPHLAKVHTVHGNFGFYFKVAHDEQATKSQSNSVHLGSLPTCYRFSLLFFSFQLDFFQQLLLLLLIQIYYNYQVSINYHLKKRYHIFTRPTD